MDKEEEISKLQQGYNKVIKEIVEQDKDKEYVSIKKPNVKDRTKYKGFSLAYAYHCDRCNYLWFPKDFDPEYGYPIMGKNILKVARVLGLPKACARCKSEYWYKAPKRKSRVNKKYRGLNSPLHDPSDMFKIPRLKATRRYIKRQLALLEKREKYWEDLAKEFNIDLEEKPPLALPLIPNKRKKKKSIN